MKPKFYQFECHSIRGLFISHHRNAMYCTEQLATVTLVRLCALSLQSVICIARMYNGIAKSVLFF